MTASKFKEAASTDPSQPSVSLIKRICYPESYKFFSKATSWDLEHEKDAKAAYISSCKSDHRDLRFSETGLVVNSDYPFLGASPDGEVACSCCGKGIIEIKCPFTCREKTFDEAVEDRDFCLMKQPDGKFALQKRHQYYYQVQAQLKITAAAFCDFVVFRPGSLVFQRLYPDDEFIAPVIEKIIEFYKFGVLPELLAKWYTRAVQESQTASPSVPVGDPEYCFCKGKEAGEMIMCDNKNCIIQWFHTTCLHIRKVQNGKWFCPECR